jgi:hypothetical protein
MLYACKGNEQMLANCNETHTRNEQNMHMYNVTFLGYDKELESNIQSEPRHTIKRAQRRPIGLL